MADQMAHRWVNLTAAQMAGWKAEPMEALMVPHLAQSWAGDLVAEKVVHLDYWTGARWGECWAEQKAVRWVRQKA